MSMKSMMSVKFMMSMKSMRFRYGDIIRDMMSMEVSISAISMNCIVSWKYLMSKMPLKIYNVPDINDAMGIVMLMMCVMCVMLLMTGMSITRMLDNLTWPRKL
jgi:hypothetical protein